LPLKVHSVQLLLYNMHVTHVQFRDIITSVKKTGESCVLSDLFFLSFTPTELLSVQIEEEIPGCKLKNSGGFADFCLTRKGFRHRM